MIDQACLPGARGLVSVIGGYARTFVLLKPFDNERLARDGFAEDVCYAMKSAEAHEGITALKAGLMGRGEVSGVKGAAFAPCLLWESPINCFSVIVGSHW